MCSVATRSLLSNKAARSQKQAFLSVKVPYLLSNPTLICGIGAVGGIAAAMVSDAVMSMQYYRMTGDGSMLGMYHSMYKAANDPSVENLKDLALSELLSL